MGQTHAEAEGKILRKNKKVNMTPVKHFTVEEIKAKRVEIDALIQFVEKEQEFGTEGIANANPELYSMASYQVYVHLIESKMWLGKMLEGRGNPFPKELADKAAPITGATQGATSN